MFIFVNSSHVGMQTMIHRTPDRKKPNAVKPCSLLLKQPHPSIFCLSSAHPLNLSNLTETAEGRAHSGSGRGGDGVGTSGHGALARAAVPDTGGLAADGDLTAESAGVLGVLGDFHLLDLLTQGSTVAVSGISIRSMLLGDIPSLLAVPESKPKINIKQSQYTIPAVEHRVASLSLNSRRPLVPLWLVVLPRGTCVVAGESFKMAEVRQKLVEKSCGKFDSTVEGDMLRASCSRLAGLDAAREIRDR